MKKEADCRKVIDNIYSTKELDELSAIVRAFGVTPEKTQIDSIKTDMLLGRRQSEEILTKLHDLKDVVVKAHKMVIKIDSMINDVKTRHYHEVYRPYSKQEFDELIELIRHYDKKPTTEITLGDIGDFISKTIFLKKNKTSDEIKQTLERINKSDHKYSKEKLRKMKDNRTTKYYYYGLAHKNKFGNSIKDAFLKDTDTTQLLDICISDSLYALSLIHI